MSKISNGQNIQRWENFDKHTVTNEETQTIQHGTSAGENLKAAGKNLVNTFDPTNHLREVWDNKNYGSNMVSQGLGFGLSVLMTPWALAGEVVDIVAQPVAMMKNLVDAGVHGVAAGIQALRD